MNQADESVNPDEHWMREALREARAAAAEGEVPIGAVVVANGRVIGRGHNQVERLHDPTAHAEMIAITAACEHLNAKYLRDCTLYVTIEPCVMCAGALAWAQLARVVYGAAEPKVGFHLRAPEALHPRTELVGGILATEAADLMRSFFQARR
jgi:tRNA(adenine34) deaminase